METGILIGATPSKTVETVTNGIMQILNSANDQVTKQIALEVFKQGVQAPNYNTISNVSINDESRGK